jgi:hypothetical protein
MSVVYGGGYMHVIWGGGGYIPVQQQHDTLSRKHVKRFHHHSLCVRMPRSVREHVAPVCHAQLPLPLPLPLLLPLPLISVPCANSIWG